MDFNSYDIELTKRALELAARGTGLVSPNPLVGCVIVSAKNEIVGEGTYTFDGVVHAEAVALEQAGTNANGGTAYISLEPHDHYSKTPPCTDALINAGIKRVVCPAEDPNPLVSGRGFQKLRTSGIEVVTGILADEGAALNEKFAVWHRKGRPFVHLKMAASLDGRISLDRSASTALSGVSSLKRVHELRHEYDAILIGGNTAIVDDPMLTDRSEKPRRRPLARIVLDNRLRLSPDSKMANTTEASPVIIFSNTADTEKIAVLQKKGVAVELLENGARNLESVLQNLKRREIQSILVEGGSEVAGAFLDAGLVDKITFLFAPLIVGGANAPHLIGGRGSKSLASAVRLQNVTSIRHGDDIEVTGYPA